LSYLFMTLLTLQSSFALLPIPLQLQRVAKYGVAATIVFFAFRGLHTEPALLGLMVKGTLGAIGYLAMVVLFDKPFRSLVSNFLLSRFRPGFADTECRGP